MRPKGAKNKKLKYDVSVRNMLTNQWENIGQYKNYRDIATRLNYTYDQIRNLGIGRNRNLSRVVKIEKI